MTDKPIYWLGSSKSDLDAFQKKTQKTAKQDIELGQQRYQAMLRLR